MQCYSNVGTISSDSTNFKFQFILTASTWSAHMLTPPPPFYIVVIYCLRSTTKSTSLSNFSSFLTMARAAKAVSPTATTPIMEATHWWKSCKMFRKSSLAEWKRYLCTSPCSELVNLLALGVSGLDPLHLCSCSGVSEPLLTHTVFAQAVLRGVLVHMLLAVFQVVLRLASTFQAKSFACSLSHRWHAGFHGSLDLKGQALFNNIFVRSWKTLSSCQFGIMHWLLLVLCESFTEQASQSASHSLPWPTRPGVPRCQLIS